ncbi:MAG: NINE protein [Cyanobacteria bacterium]|nr:NINE protein [Cyanobacteria bacterium CG_2015-16_32_12]NCO78928.1 NINE protein [Cyanobacteria bacterium CG_2015-22_32_23]NCQ04949.1 NINE protein [Cyanobacteria bacterium CG_2015-09_32_10]NCQ40792.1 NINE protein [Cyanobacteria bacterium CG_2015-04_32_10]NCS83801.1 NINE protein [Cyanobacteria bacterium CG_2015-02_32_10]
MEAKNKSVAIILAFFLGSFGIHKFYLGNNFAGILYLVFFWTFIPALLAIFDFIGLLLMSDNAFNAQYNVNIIPAAQSNSITTLSELKKLYDQGIITADEYEEKRRKFLDKL